jgi:hypothetical protein
MQESPKPSLGKVLGNSTLVGEELARKCYLQKMGASLPSSVSSSGGGLPGRPGLERV